LGAQYRASGRYAAGQGKRPVPPGLPAVASCGGGRSWRAAAAKARALAIPCRSNRYLSADGPAHAAPRSSVSTYESPRERVIP
jgi:hypothetical protein